MMTKKKSWFNLFKRFFLQDANSRSEKKDKRKRWVFGRFKNKALPSIAPNKTVLDQSEEENQKNAVTAEANKLVLISSCSPQSSNQHCITEPQEIKSSVARSYYTEELEIQNLSATKIQSAFRGYLGRKALKALKGVVKLQAIIRGWAVRRQAMNALKCLQAIVNIQTEVRAKRSGMINYHHYHPFEESVEKDIKMDLNSQTRRDETLLSTSQKRWDDSVLSKEEANAISMSRRVAAIKRERIREYWLNHRRSAESEHKSNLRHRYWLDQWVDKQLNKREDFDQILVEDKLKYVPKDNKNEGLDSLVMHTPRRSFHQRKHSYGEESIDRSAIAVPTYMAATESAKARVRSLSSPRLRPNMDALSEINSPYKHKLSPISSINSDMTFISHVSRPIVFSQKSPSFKGLSGSVKPKQGLKDFKFTPESTVHG